MSNVVEQFIRKFQEHKINIPQNETENHLEPTENQQLALNRSLYGQEISGIPTKRGKHNDYNPFTPYGEDSQSPHGLPLLPSSWFEEMSAENAEFLSLMSSGNVQTDSTGYTYNNDLSWSIGNYRGGDLLKTPVGNGRAVCNM